MKMHCFGCNVEKDTEVLESSPTADVDGLTDEPIPPLFVLDVQGPRIPNDPDGYSEFRQTVVCHTCFHALEPDMWIGESCWIAINPTTPYDKLPLYQEGIEKPEQLKPLP